MAAFLFGAKMTLPGDILRANNADMIDVAGFVDKYSLIYCGTSGGSANAHTLSTPQTFNAPTGITISFLAGFTNTTTTPTINVNGIGATTILRQTGGALYAGDITAGREYTVFHNGTNWILLNPTLSVISYVPTFAVAAGTINSGAPTLTYARYIKKVEPLCKLAAYFNWQQDGSATSYIEMTLDVTAASFSGDQFFPIYAEYAANPYLAGFGRIASGASVIRFYRPAGTSWPTGAGNYVIANLEYFTA